MNTKNKDMDKDTAFYFIRDLLRHDCLGDGDAEAVSWLVTEHERLSERERSLALAIAGAWSTMCKSEETRKAWNRIARVFSGHDVKSKPVESVVLYQVRRAAGLNASGKKIS